MNGVEDKKYCAQQHTANISAVENGKTGKKEYLNKPLP